MESWRYLTAGLINYKIYLADYTISDYFEFINGTSAPPESKYWIWILARPIFTEYKTYYTFSCIDFNCDTKIVLFLNGYYDSCLNTCNVGQYCCYATFYRENNTITTAITYISYNVINNVKSIIGRREYGQPPKEIVDMMFSGTEEQYVKTLYPGQSLLFSDILNTYDAIDFELGAPVGAMATAFLKYYGLITNPYVRAFIAGFSVDIAQEGSVYISGSLHNVGDDPSILNDYNVVEDVYIRVSKYEYVKNGYRFKVPIGIYFRTV